MTIRNNYFIDDSLEYLHKNINNRESLNSKLDRISTDKDLLNKDNSSLKSIENRKQSQ